MSTTRSCSSGCGSSIPTTYTRKAASARTPRKSFLTIESWSPSSSRTKLTGELRRAQPGMAVPQKPQEQIWCATRSGFRRRGAAGELAQRGVPHILQVGDADLAGVEPVAREIAQKCKEGHSLAERGIFFGVLAEGDQVQNFLLLLRRALHEDVAITIRASGIQPEKPTAEFQLIFRILAGEQIDKFRRACFHRPAGFFILGDNSVAQKQQRGVLRRREIFRRVRARRSRSPLLVHHLVDVLGGLRGDNLQNRSTDRAHGQRPQYIAPAYALICHALPTSSSSALLCVSALCISFFSRSTHYKLPFLASSRRYSEARQESAMIVSVGFLSGLVTNGAPSVTNRFFTSCAWQYPFSTDVFGSAPIRAVPTSWRIFPPSRIPKGYGPSIAVLVRYSPPAASTIARNVCC